MQFKETTAVYADNHMKPTNTKLSVKAEGSYGLVTTLVSKGQTHSL
jgi:hypothetical protein